MRYLLTFICILFLSFSYGQTAEEHIKKSKEQLRLKNYWACVEHANKAISIDSLNSKYYWLRSKCLVNDNQFDAALSDINMVGKLSGKYTGKMYGRIGAINYYKGKKIARQSRIVKDNEDNFNDPDPAKKAKEKLKYYYDAKLLFENALQTFNKATKINPDIDVQDLVYMTKRDLKKVNKEIFKLEK